MMINEMKSCQIWDPVNARFQLCALIYISSIPVLFSCLTLITFSLRVLAKRYLTLKWAINFIEEPDDGPSEAAEPIIKSRGLNLSRTGLFLLLSCLCGFVAQSLSIFFPSFRAMMILPTIAWVSATLILAVTQSNRAAVSSLAILVSIAVTQFILFIDGDSCLKHTLSFLSALFALAATISILLVPMRSPRCSIVGISPPFTAPTSELRSPEDNITLWQFLTVSWMAPLISLGSTRQLSNEDVWSLGYEFKHRYLHENFRDLTGSVLGRLLAANWLDLCIVSVLGIIELFANFASPVLLQKMLQSIENPFAPNRAGSVYAILTLTVRLVATQSSTLSLWYGRRVYERSRGELITMLYEKTLSRKVVGVSRVINPDQDSNCTTNNGDLQKSSGYSTFRNCYTMLTSSIRWFCGLAKDSPKDKGVDSASTGKILNLIRFDAYEVAQRFWSFSNVITLPLKVIFSVFLIWRLLGWSCLVGIVTVLLAQLINLLLARVLISWEQKRKVATDTKLHQISQFVGAIRHLRYYAWQDVWLKGIMVARHKELRLRVVTTLLGILISFTNSLASYMFPVVAFWALTTLSGQPLRIDIAFPALQLLTMLEESLRDLPNLTTIFLNARVSLRRLDAFMNEPDIDKTEFLPSSNVAMRNASFAWPGTKKPVLFDISLSFQSGLNIIYGEVGAGKSALLQALLGELDLLSGELYHTGEMIGYCGQTPWLQSMSIRENILFFAPFEKTRYTAVLEACALLPDLETFKHGDLSMIGENGVGLSGGQRARISLARAMFSKSKLLLLDDPLSALDHQTAKLIVEKCFAGPLVQGKTIILVTHRTDLCLGIAKQVIHVSNGRASVINPTTTPIEAKIKPLASQPHITVPAAEVSQDQNSVPEKFMEDEYRAHGGVQLHVYWEYVKAASLKLWLVLVCVLALFRLVEIGKTWFLKRWGEAYNEPTTNIIESLIENWPSPETDIRPWLTGFFFLALAQSFAYLFSQMLMFAIIYKAGKNLFERGMRNVTYATFRFYDVTPVGRLMNRLTSDMNTVDGNISIQFQDVAMLLISWVSSLIIIGSVTPLFLFFAVGLTLGFILIFLWALPTSQSLRRLEMVSLTPLISNFGTVTHGLATIRAYCASSLFQDRVIAETDNFQKMDHFYWSSQAWLFYRLDILSALSSFILTILALFTGLSAGLAAFVFTAFSNFVTATHSLCRQYGQLQMDFVSVERVVEILDIPQEQSGRIIPPASWPRYGSDIIFENVSIRYAPHLESALSDISLTIKGGTTTALTGRTGSGKSTLALAILATIHPIQGRIIIDGLDLATIDTQCLRSRITFLAQEPILFPGTLQKNLDPLAQYSATECASVLATITGGRYDWSLAMEIHTGGSNLSQGQRQLVGLARALLRRSPIVVLDEATASVDTDTATRVQTILREFLRESTIVTIAHRAEAVNEANTIVTLAKGQIERIERVCT